MNCEQVQKYLPALPDEDLSPATAAEMRAHLAGCPACQKEEQALSSSWNMLGELKAIEPSPHFRERLWERIKKEQENEKSWMAFPRYVYAFSLVGIWVMGIGIGSFFYLRATDVRSGGEPSAVAPLLQLNDPISVERVYFSRWKGASS